MGSENSTLKIYGKLSKKKNDIGLGPTSFNVFIWNKENEVWHIMSSFSVWEKLLKLLSVNTALDQNPI